MYVIRDACFLDLVANVYPTQLALDYHYRCPLCPPEPSLLGEVNLDILLIPSTSLEPLGDEADGLLLESASNGWSMPSLPPFHPAMG